MLEFGRLLGEMGLETVFHFAYKTTWKDVGRDVRLLEDLGLAVSEDTRSFVPEQAVVRGPANVVRRVIAEVAVRVRAVNPLVHLAALRGRLSEIGDVYRREDPDIVILASDVPTWDTSAFVKAARDQGRPTAVAFTQTGPLEESNHVCSRTPSLSLSRPWNKVLAAIYPKWIGERGGKRFLLTPFGPTLAAELLGASAPQPWIESSSNADVVLVENEACLDRGAHAGLSDDNLIVTGQAFHDVLHGVSTNRSVLLDRLYEVHDLTTGKPIILTSLPPDYAGRDNLGAEHGSYHELVEFWVKSLTAFHDYHTLISLHPSQRRDDYAFVEGWGAKLALPPISEIIPLSHAFVTSNSTTITMAIACGVPVVSYDAAGYAQTSFDTVPGVLKATTKTEFTSTLRQLLEDSSEYTRVAALQATHAKRWGVLDGCAMKRVADVIIQLVTRTRQRRLIESG